MNARSRPSEPPQLISVLLVGLPDTTADAIAQTFEGSGHARFAVNRLNTDQAGAHREAQALIYYDPNSGDGLAYVERHAAAMPATVILVMGPPRDPEVGLDFVRAGAADYLIDQPGCIAALPRIISYAVERRAMSARMRRLSEQRRDVETLLSAAFELSATPMALSEESGSLVLVNHAFTKLFGWPSSEATGQSLGRDLLHGLGDPRNPPVDVCVLRHREGQDIMASVRRTTAVMHDKTLDIWAFIPDQPLGRPEPAGHGLAGLVGADSKRLTAGRIQLICLDEIRKELGDRWDRWAERVYDLAERTIRKRLAPEDVVARDKEGAFVICFAELDSHSAWFKAQALQQEIARLLFGESGGQDMGQLVVETHEVDITPEEAASNDIAGLISLKLTREAERLRLEQTRILTEMFHQGRLELRPVLIATGPSPVLFADIDDTSRMTLGRLRLAAGNDPRLISEIDLMLLGRVAIALPDILVRRPDILVVVTLHASTLKHRQLRDRLYAVCRQMPEAYRRALALRIVDLPSDILPARVTELLSPLRALSRLRILELQRIEQADLPLRDCGVSMAELDYGLLADCTARDPEGMKRCLANLKLARTHLIAVNVPPRDTGTAIKFGARFIISAREMNRPGFAGGSNS